jgi:hypothetical protein
MVLPNKRIENERLEDIPTNLLSASLNKKFCTLSGSLSKLAATAKDFQHKLRNKALDYDIKHFKKKFDMLIDMTQVTIMTSMNCRNY